MIRFITKRKYMVKIYYTGKVHNKIYYKKKVHG